MNDEDLRRALTLEKRVCEGLLDRLFKGAVSRALLNSFYSPSISSPQFVEPTAQCWPSIIQAHRTKPREPARGAEGESVWCRINVQGFSDKHFEKNTFPEFSISIVQLDGSPLPRVVEEGQTKPMADMRIRISVLNKWANVSTEVLKDVEFVRTLKDGKLVVSDLVFQEISLKHGGFFILTIDPIDYKHEVLPWKSPEITIQSVKTHSNKKRKTRDGRA
eukprot:c16378_g1_i2.p1 GENE.c16378_g1_i2~~c16378_g1_i2.p1  ORF type:complete len:219 (-),score=39.78 c16378_g1_i2:102-758(-)